MIDPFAKLAGAESGSAAPFKTADAGLRRRIVSWMSPTFLRTTVVRGAL